MRWANSLGAARPVTVCSTWQVSRPPCPRREQLGGRLRPILVLPRQRHPGAWCAPRLSGAFQPGLVSKMPSIVAVQAAGCAPLARSFENGQANPAEIEGEPTIAEGCEQIARAWIEIANRVPGNMTFLERTVNGQPGLVAQQDGVTVTVFAFDVGGDRIRHIWVVRNPDKLQPWTSTKARLPGQDG